MGTSLTGHTLFMLHCTLSKPVSKIVVAALILLTLPSAALSAEDEHTDERLAPYHYVPSDDARADVTATVSTAKRENKLAMIVLGAEWCHDSRGFGSKISEPAMQSILNAWYEVRFVDVGYLEDRRELTQSLGYPINFGTPTVLVIDPESGQLINRDEVSIWQNADSTPLSDYEAHFQMLADTRDARVASAGNEPDLPELNRFISDQTQRLAEGYVQLQPLMKQFDQNRSGPRPENFDALWEEVWEFRTQLQKDIIAQRRLLQNSPDATTNISWPAYGPFSWE